jgi:hypothetical protein
MRALFVFSATAPCVTLWSKRFPSVETRAVAQAKAGRTKLLPVGEEEDVATAFAQGLDAHLRQGETVSIMAPEGRSTLVFAACGALGHVVGFPLLSAQEEKERGSDLLSSPALMQALDTVTQVAAYVASALASASPATPPHYVWASVGATVSMAMPLGTLIRPLFAAESLAQLFRRDGDEERLQNAAASGSDGSVVTKTPSWRVVEATMPPTKRMRVFVTVEETIESNQYDKALGATDSARLFGRVTLWSDLILTGCAAPEISLKVRLGKNAPPDQRDWLGRVGSAQSSLSSDASDLSFTCIAGQGAEASDRICHITVCPPLKLEQALMRFEAVPPATMPFRAFYQMKPTSPREARLLIQLKLTDRVSNSFEFCNLVMPFASLVESFEVSPTEGVVKKLPDGRSLVWELGTSVSGRKLECALPMTVRFAEPIAMANAASSSPSCFADLVFKMLDNSLAGVQVDSEDVIVYPKGGSFSVTINYVVKSGTYRVWNSLGESVRFVAAPPQQ